MSGESFRRIAGFVAAGLLVLVQAPLAFPLPAADPESAAPSLSMVPLRGPIDETSYVVGPGDLFGITIFAPSVGAQKILVNPEGDLLLPGIGSVHVSGSTLRQAKADIRKALRGSYRNTRVEVALIRLRIIEVHVTGRVVQPGTYVGTAQDVIGTLIDAAGGLTHDASQRRIRITDRNGESRWADLVRYRQTGDRAANPAILDGALIFVPFRKSEVTIDGAVELPDTYEWVDGDTIGSMIEIAGGLRQDARTDSLEFRRLGDDGTAETSVVAFTDAIRSTPLRDGDQIHLRFRDDYHRLASVTIEGEVVSAGPYGIVEGVDRLSDVIGRAGGFTAAASLDEAALIRADVEEKEDLEFERLKEIPVQDMSETEYAYFKSKSRERKGLVVLDFTRLSEGDDSEDRLLEDGDRIVIPVRRETVTISGRIRFPGLVSYVPGRNAGYYIAKVGGFASNADRGGTRVIKGLTGEWVSTSESGPIVPGDEIWVPERAERDWWGFTQEVVRFAASIATVYLVIDRASD